MLALQSAGHVVEASTLRGSASYGVRLLASGDTVRGNHFLDNAVGLRADAGGNAIFDNHFRGAVHAESAVANTWNVAKAPGPNIRGGPWIGGNWWEGYCGTDYDGDALSDSPVPHTSGGRIKVGGDSAPLIRPPVAVTSVSIAPVANLNQTGRFDGTRSHDPLGRAFTAEWRFGDGASASGLYATHEYKNVGLYGAELRLTADDCEVTAYRIPIHVTDQLRVALAMTADAYGMREEPRGSVAVRFQNGEPVPGAELGMLVAYNATDHAPLDSFLAGLNDSPTTVDWTAETGDEGAYGFAVPLFLAESVDPSLPGVLNAPGNYTAYLHAAWGGNAGASDAVYRVEVPRGQRSLFWPKVLETPSVE